MPCNAHMTEENDEHREQLRLANELNKDWGLFGLLNFGIKQVLKLSGDLGFLCAL